MSPSSAVKAHRCLVEDDDVDSSALLSRVILQHLQAAKRRGIYCPVKGEIVVYS